MHRIDSNGCNLEIGSILESSLDNLLTEQYADAKKIILVDDNTREYCLSHLVSNYDQLSNAEVIQIPCGEDSKQLEIAKGIWGAMTEYNISRYDLLINLGGGMITDMGGFIASCYKRGIDFINIPTSLLGMVDASIGGKTGVNLGPFKNQIGLFSNPVVTYIDVEFLDSLPDEEYYNGFGEVIKHGLIGGDSLFTEVSNKLIAKEELDDELMLKVIQVKNEIVLADPQENNVRKKLNFGHTIGHVIEGHFMSLNGISHGHAVAIGMLMEAYLSVKLIGLSNEEYERIEKLILANYPIPHFSDEDINVMIAMLRNDKKNKGGVILCCLLKTIGDCQFDNEIKEEDFIETFLHFKNKQLNLN